MTSQHLMPVLSGLDDEQRAAVVADPGPVCVLAGAGTGKTRAVTHRIAYRVLRGDLRGQHVTAVTFTARAAGELRDRLRDLGVTGVNARTFHSAALRQLRYFAPRLYGRELPELVDSTVKFVGIAAARVGLRTDRTKNRDLATELEWAASSLISPDEYPAVVARVGRQPPVDAADVAKVYAAYREAKQRAGVMDFADLLDGAATAIEEHDDIAAQIRSQYRLFVVDEYQDVNPLQQRLLEAWLGERDDLTVVGDASQTIYSFTGATSKYLIDFPRRYPDARIVRLVRDYRSTPQVVGLANKVIAESRGGESRLRLELVGQRPSGPQVCLATYPDVTAEADAVAGRCAQLIADGIPAAQIAVLYRTNAQSESYEAALAAVGVPAVVTGAERFFQRAEIRSAMVALRSAVHTDAGEATLRDSVVTALEAVGWRPGQPPPGGGAAREKYEAVAALVQLAEELPDLGLAEFTEELARRAAAQHAPTVDGVTLASLHSAKGLEWDAVFLAGLCEGTLPSGYARTPAELEEERRLLYVGITRARYWLHLSFGAARTPGGRARQPSSFLTAYGLGGDGAAAPAARRRRDRKSGGRLAACRICGTTLADAAQRKLGRCDDCPSDIDEALFERLRVWRKATATASGVPAYVVFTDATLTAIAEQRPGSNEDLVAIPGIGPRKLDQYGDSVLALVDGAEPEDALPLPSTEQPSSEIGR